MQLWGRYQIIFIFFFFLQPNAIAQPFDILEFFIRGKKKFQGDFGTNSSIIIYVKASLELLNVTFS